MKDTKVTLQNQLGGMKVIPYTLKNALKYIAEQLKETDRKIRELLKKEEEFAMNASLMMSVPGISYTQVSEVCE